jgi:hypothetical protein
VQPDGIGAVRGTGAEDSRGRPRRVVTRPGDQHVAVSPVEPGHHDEPGARDNVAYSIRHPGLEDQPGVRRASSPCRGACARSVSGDSTQPMGSTWNLVMSVLTCAVRYAARRCGRCTSIHRMPQFSY